MTSPVPVAIVVCDSLYTDGSTGKAALVGLFNDIFAMRLPVVHPRMCVYVSITDVKPSTKFSLDVVNPETEHVVAKLEGIIPKEVTPVHVCDMNFRLNNLVFPSQGLYYIRFWANGNLVLQRPFSVHEGAPKQKGEQNAGND